MADFGFATCCCGENDLIIMPKSEPWNAPEHHHRLHLLAQARKMDVYSYGMLCFWFIFEAGVPGSLPLLSPSNSDLGQFLSFENWQSENNLLQNWKYSSDQLLEYIMFLIESDQCLNSSLKASLTRFFMSTLPFHPDLRAQSLEQPLEFIMSDR